jgi:uroporphyrinogen decarboxylase
MQIVAGARTVMIFDTWGGVLSNSEYVDFSLRYMKEIASQLMRDVNGQRIPVVFFTKHCDPWLELLAASGCDAIGLDSTVDMASARQRVAGRVALQGNLDPFLLFAKPDRIEQAVIDILDGYGPGPGHVFNLGHGIDKDTPIDSVERMVEAVRHYGHQPVTQEMELVV